jgi:Icc-related predicted phosphoesterase
MNTDASASLVAPCRIGVIGDFHGSSKRAALRLFLAEAKPDLLLSVGDLQDYEPWPLPTYFTHGNHESFATIKALDAGIHTPRNLTHLLDAQPISLAGLRVVGLGGIWEAPPGSPRYLDRAAYDRLADMSADIVVSHETPLHFANGHPDKTCEPLRNLCEIIAPRLWLSGHHHHYDEEILGQTTILSLGKFPHEWATIDVGDEGDLTVARFVPRERARYDRMLERWREAALTQKAGLNREV